LLVYSFLLYYLLSIRDVDAPLHPVDALSCKITDTSRGQSYTFFQNNTREKGENLAKKGVTRRFKTQHVASSFIAYYNL